MALVACTSPVGVYRPRRPLTSPLCRLLSDHFEHFRGQYEDAFEHEYGRWRRVVDAGVGRDLDCGVLEAGFARVRCPELRSRVPAGFQLQDALLLPQLPRETARRVDIVAGR